MDRIQTYRCESAVTHASKPFQTGNFYE